MDEMKTCSCCGVSKPPLDFRKNENKCKACCNKSNYERQRNNPERLAKYRKRDYQKNKIQKLLKVREWHKHHPEACVIYRKRYAEKLTASYVLRCQGLSAAQASPEIIELARKKIIHYRLLRELKTELTKKSESQL